MRFTLPALLAAGFLAAAPLPFQRIVVYKNGVAFYERSGVVKPGEPAALEFRAADMDDVLKSLVLDAPGGVARLRYEFRDSRNPAALPGPLRPTQQQPLAVLLDHYRGARVEMDYRGSPASGVIVSGRAAPLPNQGQKQELTLLLDSGAFAIIDLDAVSGLRFSDPRLQKQFADALARMARDLVPDRRTVFIDLSGAGQQRVTVRYLAPAPVWKSTYRLLLPDSGDATLEGWAIIENATGEDWNQVSLSAVSGRPVSFLTRLLEARYVNRREVDLPGIEPLAPQLHAGALASEEKSAQRLAARASPMAVIRGKPADESALAAPAAMELSNVEPAAEGRDAGELFEYRFSTPVNARAGESLLLPFFQGRIAARKLLIYSDRSQPNPRHAVELSNTTGNTLDGGPVTVYHSTGYAGEALLETLKKDEKRLISYAVDQAVRITTNFESGQQVVRTVTARRGVITTRSAASRTTVYTVSNSEAKEKTLLIEHAAAPGWKLLSPKPAETTPSSWRFSVALPAQGGAKLAVVEEQELESSTTIASLTPDVLFSYIQNRALGAEARRQLEAIIAKKNEIAGADEELRQAETGLRDLVSEQDRLRQNINTLRNVAGQQEQVNRYAAELSKGDVRIAQLRDRLSELRRRKAALETELNALIGKLEF
ncbi:MAG: DUF4139 domain-containing protein [Bryobacteraceae bacterium]